MLKTLIIATVLLPTLAIVQRSQQLPQPRQPGQWCPMGWMASGNYCVPGSDKAPAAIPKNGWCRPAGARAAVIASAEGPRLRASNYWQRRTNVWLRVTSPARSTTRLRSGANPATRVSACREPEEMENSTRFTVEAQQGQLCVRLEGAK